MRSPFGITTTGPAPQPGVLCALQATRAAVALSAGVIAVCAFKSSISGRSTVAPLTPCARNAATKATPWATPAPVSGVSVEVGALIDSDRGGMGGMAGIIAEARLQVEPNSASFCPAREERHGIERSAGWVEPTENRKRFAEPRSEIERHDLAVPPSGRRHGFPPPLEQVA